MSRVGDVSWRVDHTLCSSASHDLKTNSGQLTLEALPSQGKGGEMVSMHMTQDKLRVLIHELEAARDMMRAAE